MAAVSVLSAAVFVFCVVGHVHSYLADPSLTLDASDPNDVFVNPDIDLAQASDQQLDPSILEPEALAMRVTHHKCSCTGTDCQCCAEIKLRIIIRLKACAEFTYDPASKALDFRITVNHHAVFEKKISVATPVKFCHAVDIHHLKISLCVGLKDISFEKGHAGACIYMEVDAAVFHWKEKLGCLYKSMKANKIAADADGQGYRALGFQ